MKIIIFLILMGFTNIYAQQSKLVDGFTVPASTIGFPAADGVSGTITNTGGSNYRVRSINGMWWMIQNADKPLTKADGCSFNSINRNSYGNLYTWKGAELACPTGWRLP